MYCETTATTTTNDVRLQFKSVYYVKTIAEMGIMRWFLVTRHGNEEVGHILSRVHFIFNYFLRID